jgi:hypothetical protein
MRKDTRLSFRVGSDLKKTLETVAAIEGRSVAQISEVFLRAGAERYRKEGQKFIKNFVNKQGKQ